MIDKTIKIIDLHNYPHEIILDRIKSLDSFYNVYDKKDYTIINLEVKKGDVNNFTSIKTEESKHGLNTRITFLKNQKDLEE